MRKDGSTNAAAAGANIGAYALSKSIRPKLDKQSAENIAEIPLTVNGYRGENSVKKVMYMEKGLGITFTDANGNNTTYTIGQDGKIYDAKNRVISTLTMDANQYAVLDAMSKEARESTKKRDGSDINDKFDVLTAQDIRSAEDNMHPYSEQYGKRLNNPDAKEATAHRVIGAMGSTGGDKTVTLNQVNGHVNDVDSKNGKFTIKLVEGYTVTGQGNHKYHPKAGSVSVFIKE